MKIYLASDHAGFELKNALLGYLRTLDYETEDCGAFSYEPEDDFPDFVNIAAKKVSKSGGRAIVIGGSGQGEAMAANRYKGLRAAVYYGGPEEIVSLSREHNDANVLSLGARFIDEETAKKAVKIWLETGFSTNEKYQRRNDKLDRAQNWLSLFR